VNPTSFEIIFSEGSDPCVGFVGFFHFVRYTHMRTMRDPKDRSPRIAPAISGGARSRGPLSAAESEFARELFEKHRLSIYRYLRRLLHSREDASEVLQETYLRLLRQPDLERLRPNARAYLFQTATNLARDLFRRRAMKGAAAEAEAFVTAGLEAPDWESWPELAVERQQLTALLLDAMWSLDPKIRYALLLYRFQDLTHAQIAVRLQLSERTIERYIKEGLKCIKDRMEDLR
jgi:RNA polymerase sigma factor (sigma-70 family)